MREIHLRRLTTAADHLEARVIRGDRGRQFDMQSWFNWAHGATKPADEMYLADGGIQCGAAACAIGWIAGSPVLQREGFSLLPGNSPVPLYQRTESDNCGGVVVATYTGWTAVEKFFGLQCWEATWMFLAEYYPEVECEPTAVHVVARIRNFVNTARLAGVDK